MKISDNIRWILENGAEWTLFTNRSYPAKIQLADPQQIYNVPGQPGVVYNILEDAYEKVGGVWLPDLSDNGRIVNGAIFDKLYQPFAG